MSLRKHRKRIITISIILGMAIFIILNTKITFPAQSQSIVASDIVYVQQNQTLSDMFTNALDDSGIPATERFTVQTDSILFDSNGKQFPSSTLFSKKLNKLSLIDERGNLLDKGSVQVTFTGLSTRQAKNIEVKATAFFYLDELLIVEKKLYAKGTTEDNRIKLYVANSFVEPSIGQRKYDFTFTFADEGKDWQHDSEHHFKIILKDVTFTNFITTEQWGFFGEETVYDLSMTIDQQKEVTLDEKLDEAISIFKKDNAFTVCADSGSIGTGFGSSSPSPATTPMAKIMVNGIHYDTIESLQGISRQDLATTYFSVNHIVSGSYSSPDVCKTILLPRNAEVIAIIKNIDYKFFTPKSKSSFGFECHNVTYGIGAKETQYGDSRYVNFGQRFTCTGNIGFSE